jgi:hypothetical protein
MLTSIVSREKKNHDIALTPSGLNSSFAGSLRIRAILIRAADHAESNAQPAS